MLLFMLAKDVRDFAISLSAKETGGCYLLVKCLRIKGRELQSYTQMTWLCQQLFLGLSGPRTGCCTAKQHPQPPRGGL